MAKRIPLYALILASFTSSRTGRNQVWRIAVDGGEAEQITDMKDGVASYVLSPNGKQVAFTAHEPDPGIETAIKEKRDVTVVDENPPNCVVPRFALDRLHPLQAARGGIPDDRGYLRSGRRIGRGKAAGGDRIGGERAALLARWPVDRVSAKFESTPLGDRWQHRLVAAGRRRGA
jgi:hypothetical protein